MKYSKYKVRQQLSYKVQVEKTSTLAPLGHAGGNFVYFMQLLI